MSEKSADPPSVPVTDEAATSDAHTGACRAKWRGLRRIRSGLCLCWFPRRVGRRLTTRPRAQWVGPMCFGLVVPACSSASAPTPQRPPLHGTTVMVPTVIPPAPTTSALPAEGATSATPNVPLPATTASGLAGKDTSNRPTDGEPRFKSISLPVPKGFFVIAHGVSSDTGWNFATEPLEGRVLIEASLRGGETRHRELANSRWLKADDL